jgi:hypothetical protein
VKPALSYGLEAKPVTDVVEADGMRGLGKEHGRQMAENAENAGFCLRPSFLGCLIENASRYKVEKLLEDDNIRRGSFLVHTPTEW